LQPIFFEHDIQQEYAKHRNIKEGFNPAFQEYFAPLNIQIKIRIVGSTVIIKK